MIGRELPFEAKTGGNCHYILRPAKKHCAFLLESIVESVLRGFLAEDIGFGDITTDALVRHDIQATGYVVCKETGVIAGIREARVLLQIVRCNTTRTVRDGDIDKPVNRIIY